MSDPFDRIQENQEAEIFHTLSIEDIDAFARLTGDTNPLHMDDEFAAQTTFRQRVGHGMLTASFISTMIGTKLPGAGALWYEQHLRFLAPARVGEKIRIWARVKHKSTGQRVLTLETLVFGNDGRRLIDGEAKVKVLETNEQSSPKNRKTVRGAVIVSGASRGIGAAIARELSSRGFPVLINYRNSKALAESLAEEMGQARGMASTFQADMSDPKAVAKMVAFAKEHFGSLSGLVNNASTPVDVCNFEDLKWEAVQQQIDLQLKGALLLSQAALPHLLENSGGAIVNIGSIAADGVPPVKLLPYIMAKSALAAMTRSLAAELGPRNIRVNCVSPGMTETDYISNFPEKVKLTTKMQTPLRRLGVPEDVAGVVGFLFDEKARHLTGQTLRVCGGMFMA